MKTRTIKIALSLAGLAMFACRGGLAMNDVINATETAVIRRAGERGRANFGWLDSRHSFSFGDYYDPAHMGYGPLRVINDDRVAPGRGFGTHPHDNMEIISYVVHGELAHKDSMGNGTTIRPGDVQRMSAGTGITHSEFNPSETESVRFLQIWIIPDTRCIDPSYEQIHFPPEDRKGKLRLVGSRDGREGSITIHQDVNLYATLLNSGDTASLPTQSDRRLWVQVVRGRIKVGAHELSEGDALALRGGQTLDLTGLDDAEALVFDLVGE